MCAFKGESLTLKILTYPPQQTSAAEWRLIALHGWGANSADLLGLAPDLALDDFVMAFPEAPFPHPQVPGGRMWYGFPAGYDFQQPWDFDQDSDLQASRQMLRSWLLDLAASSSIPLEHTILAGFSQGGAMTLDVGLGLPLAGQVSLSGYLHSKMPGAVTPRPVMMVHGSFDPVVPVATAYAAKAALEQQGQVVSFHELPMGHEVSPAVISLLRQFCEDLRQGVR